MDKNSKPDLTSSQLIHHCNRSQQYMLQVSYLLVSYLSHKLSWDWKAKMIHPFSQTIYLLIITTEEWEK